MKIYYELDDLADFEPWSGAKSTWETIVDNGKGEDFISMLESAYPDGMTDTELNDLLWFSGDECLDWVGLNEDEDDEDY